MSQPLLQMRGICKSYGEVSANRSIDLDVYPGSIVGLLGENGSGKSTLMKVLFGVTTADAGGIVFKGRELEARSPAEALAAGIAMIHQHFTLVDAMTVAENVMLGWERAGRWLRHAEVAQQVRDASRAYGLSVEPNQRVGALALGAKQRVEIVKAILRGADLLILDEPTSILALPEVTALLQVLRRLRAEGRSVIFITHKLAEALAVCDQIVVLRDGRVTGRVQAGEATRESLVHMMVGRAPAEPRARATRDAGAARLSVQSLSAADSSGVSRLKDATFDLRAGEILALAGVDGNGQTELAQAIAGLGIACKGRLVLDGNDITYTNALERVQAGIAYVPADRQNASLVQSMSVADNLLLRDFARRPFSSRWHLDRAAMRQKAEQGIRLFGIKTNAMETPVKSLSGGNQQKVVVAREIGREPRVLIALQPTWGLDPEAARFVIDQILGLRDRGAAVLYISSELEEVMHVGDRVAVIFDGRIGAIFERAQADVAHVGALMAGERAAERLAA